MSSLIIANAVDHSKLPRFTKADKAANYIVEQLLKGERWINFDYVADDNKDAMVFLHKVHRMVNHLDNYCQIQDSGSPNKPKWDYCRMSINDLVKHYVHGPILYTEDEKPVYAGNAQCDRLISKKQEKKYDKKIKKVLKSLKLKNKSTYKKIKTIHDYVIKRVKYKDGKYSHTAYGALMKKKAVCDGYSLLFYDMCRRSGVHCKMILGKARGGKTWENHAWNLVRLKKRWYSLDVTWDDKKPKTKRYNYFLKKCPMKKHRPQKYYRSKKFKKRFKLAKKDYN